jgi:hypothetical protein
MHRQTETKIIDSLTRLNWRTVPEIVAISGLSIRTLYRNLPHLVKFGRVSRADIMTMKGARTAYKLPRIVYVADYGSDEFGDGSIDAPRGTIDFASKNLEGGDEVRVLFRFGPTSQGLDAITHHV